ncbi:MAG: lysylphosphatidylglycerol synthase transmembrane domain-containing protein [Pseudomonadota bacterium]
MKLRGAFLGFGAVTAFYVAAVLWIDSRNPVFSAIPELSSVLPTLLALSLLSYLVRYARWRWLLSRSGHQTAVAPGFFAYMAGFAFTATPGKVGELVRIRYLAPQGVAPSRVIAAFVYERAFDLMAVLMLAALAVHRLDVFLFAVSFVVSFLAALVAVALSPAWLTRSSVYLRSWRLKRLARLGLTLRDGLAGCRVWLTPLDATVSICAGILAWSFNSLSFIILLQHLGVSIPLLSAAAIYPLATLAGAASMVPGGVGSTEAAIVVLLSAFHVKFATAALAAVGIRFATLWFSMICGFVALGVLEHSLVKKKN